MKKLLVLVLSSAPFVTNAQELSNVRSIDSVVSKIEVENVLTKKTWDSVSYQKEDGGNDWDSAYNHVEYFFKNDHVVKIVAWNKYGDWRNDMIGYYYNGKVIKFLQGESKEGSADYGKLNFEIYYYLDNGINVSWITAKPENVLRVSSDTYLVWAYNLLGKMNSHKLR